VKKSSPKIASFLRDVRQYRLPDIESLTRERTGLDDLDLLGMIVRKTAPRPGVVVVAVAGECDLHEAPRLAAALAVNGTGSSRVLLDLSELRFLDSTTLGVLAKAKRELGEAGSELVLLAPSRQVMRTLTVAGFDSLFSILDADGQSANGGLEQGRGKRTATMFRAVNERIGELAQSWDEDELVHFVCECADETCTRPVGLPLDTFERIVRGPGANAIVHPEHAPDRWDVLESGDEYLVVTPAGSLAR